MICTAGPRSAWRWSPRRPAHVREVLDTCERAVAGRPEIELLSVRRRLTATTTACQGFPGPAGTLAGQAVAEIRWRG